MYNKQQNNVDDLFGSEEEEEEKEEKSQRRILKRADSFKHSEEERDFDEPIQDLQQDDYGYNEYEEERKQHRVEVELNMPALPIPTSTDGKYYLAKLPRFLDINLRPFDPTTLELEVPEDVTEAEQLESIRQQVESTIRWRHRIDENGAEKIESNSHFVEWEDGTKSLMIGKECFDVVTKSMQGKEYTFLLAHQTSSGVLESHTQFTDHMTFQPSAVQSLTHRHLTAHIANKHVKQTRTKMFYTESDPEKQKQELEAQENERLRAAKKLENQRRRTEIQFNTTSSSRLRDYDYGDDEELEDDVNGGSRRGGNGGYTGGRRGDKYDEDFVVDDEEYDEEEERRMEQRLSHVKQSGMNKYNNKRGYSDEEEEEVEDINDEEEDEDEEEVVVRRRKKRHLDSDEEDDE
ncbi:unnamed protein product [Cunninghamella blakesleeana]